MTLLSCGVQLIFLILSKSVADNLRPFSVGVALRDDSCDKILIGESPNFIHNVAPKRAEIGQLTPDNAPAGGHAGRRTFGRATPGDMEPKQKSRHPSRAAAHGGLRSRATS
jgi:hypothetical protein